MKEWNTTHKGHQIRIENGWFSGERLFIDGELQDEQIGYALRSRLYGTIRDENAPNEAVKVSIGGWFTMGCRVFVGDKLIYSED